MRVSIFGIFGTLENKSQNFFNIKPSSSLTFNYNSAEKNSAKMFIFIGILILVLYFYIRQYFKESLSYFDKRQLKSFKPTLKGLIDMQKKSFPELISITYDTLKGEK